MSKTHTFPSGGSFTLRDPEQVPERLRRPVSDHLYALASKVDEPAATEDGAEEKFDTALIGQADALNDLLAVALIAEWTKEVPVSLDSLLDLGKGDYDTVRRVVAPLAAALLPDFSPTPESGTPSTP